MNWHALAGYDGLAAYINHSSGVLVRYLCFMGYMCALMQVTLIEANPWQYQRGTIGFPAVTVLDLPGTQHIVSPCKKPYKRFKKYQSKTRTCTCYAPYINNVFACMIEDMISLNLGLFSWDSFKIIASVFPFYVAARMGDDKLQRCFYDERHHKNKMQLPDWCHDFAEWSISIPIVVFGLEAFFSRDFERQQTARMFLLGMPFVVFGKDIIKSFEYDACFRPWNEKFSCKKRAHGGFPSGHMAEAVYVATLYGMRFGPKFAIPLAILAGAIGITFLNCNRHYLSQLIAGAGLGALYAVSAQKIIDKKIDDKLSLVFNCTRDTISCGITFPF